MFCLWFYLLMILFIAVVVLVVNIDDITLYIWRIFIVICLDKEVPEYVKLTLVLFVDNTYYDCMLFLYRIFIFYSYYFLTLFIYLYIYMYVYLFIHLFIYLFIYLSIYVLGLIPYIILFLGWILATKEGHASHQGFSNNVLKKNVEGTYFQTHLHITKEIF